MAKITDFKFNLGGKDYKVPVNCTSSGQFNVHLPQVVADSLGLNKTIRAQSLAELEKQFNESLQRYKEAETHEELIIGIRYSACGKCIEKSDGSYMFSPNSRPEHYLDVSFGEGGNAISLEFKVFFKVTIDGNQTWYSARQGKDYAHRDEKHINNPEKWFRDNIKINMKKWKLIPYSEQAYKTLSNGVEQLRKISELLFNFISQDESQIAIALENNRLLGSPTNENITTSVNPSRT